MKPIKEMKKQNQVAQRKTTDQIEGGKRTTNNLDQEYKKTFNEQ